MTKHLDKSDELFISLHYLSEPVDNVRQLVILLRSLPAELQVILSILENTKGVTHIGMKEDLLK
uniref:Uncharacterized protein n=1 Tax=Peronospora matthiolae TaxID=2874970 RepID=A0AAV1TB09_9STRA